MKKYSIFKVLLITFFIVVLLSWLIPAGTFIDGTYVSLESTNSIGLYNLVRLPILTFDEFIKYGLLFLILGGFYGVLNQTGVYSNIVNNISSKWSDNKKVFLIITVMLFSLLTSLTGLTYLMFILVPFFAAILLKLGFNKLTSFASTVGAIFVGNMCSTFGYEVWGYLSYYFSLEMNDFIFARFVLLIMCTVLLITTLTSNISFKKSKKVKKESIEENEIPLYEESKSKKKSFPLIVLVSILFVFLLVGGYKWYNAFEIKFFYEFYLDVTSFEVAGYPLFNNILGLDGIGPIGFFSSYDMAVILVFASLIIGFVYSIKFKDIVISFAKGAKEMIVPAVYAILSCIIYRFLLMFTNETYGYGVHFLNTINNWLVKPGEFSFLGTVGTSLITGVAVNDFGAMIGQVAGLFTSLEVGFIPVVALMIQGLFGIICFIAPTSIYLVVGLSLFDISYKEWIKYIGKYVLSLFGIILIVTFILTTLI